VVVAVTELDELEDWAEALIKAVEGAGGFKGGPPPAAGEGLKVIEPTDVEAGASAVDTLLLFDTITLAFKEQRCILNTTTRSTDDTEAGAAAAGVTNILRTGSRVLGLGSSGSASSVQSLRQLQAPLCAGDGAEYQIVLETLTGSVILGMSDAELLSKWASALGLALGECVPPPTALGKTMEVDGAWNPKVLFGGGANNEEDGEQGRRGDVNFAEIDCDHCGYMFKRGNGKSLLGNTKFQERFWVLRGSQLHYYKTAAQAIGDSPTGTVELGDVHEVMGW
jgi:hypothetical protein